MRQIINGSLIWAILPAAAALVPACGKDQPTEQERYEELQEGVQFRTYKALSKRAVGPVMAEYNKSGPQDALQVDVHTVRILLGLSWAVSDKSPFTIAEGQLIIEGAADPKAQALGHIVLSLGMHGQGLPKMAKEETDKGVKGFGTEHEALARGSLTAAYLVLGTNAVKGGDFKAARTYFGGLEATTGIRWPYALADIMVDLESGKVQSGLTKAKALSRDEQTPKELRDGLAEAGARVEKETGPVDSKLFWPRLASRVLLDELRKDQRLERLFQALDKARAAL